MKVNWLAVLVAAILGGGLCAAALPRHQEQTSQKSEAAPKAAPEMERLKPYLGEWDYTESYPKSPSYPNGGQNTGVYTSKLGPGGNSLVNGFHSQGPVGDFEGLIVMTWDAREKAYKGYLFANDFPGALVETGQFEGDALVFRSELSVGGTTMKLKNVTRFLDGGRMTAEEYVTMPGAAEKLLVHVEGKKR